MYRAAETENWSRVIEILEALHESNLVTPTSRHWLGIAYLMLHRWQDALEQYEQIRTPLHDTNADARRIVNHAIARFETGQVDGCASLLRESVTSDWPVDELRRAKTLLAEIEAEH